MKTAKQKCKEMWMYFIANPLATKLDYRRYLINKGRAGEFNECWACEESHKRGTKLDKREPCYINCPIRWPVSNCYFPYTTVCNYSSSPYHTWRLSRIPEDRKSAALDMVKLIEDTWEE